MLRWPILLALVLGPGGLAMLTLPTEDPLEEMIELRHVAGDTFRRIRDDKSLGEEIRFDIGPDGRVTGLWQHSNVSRRVR